jgi:hypothetical protein
VSREKNLVKSFYFKKLPAGGRPPKPPGGGLEKLGNKLHNREIPKFFTILNNLIQISKI